MRAISTAAIAPGCRPVPVIGRGSPSVGAGRVVRPMRRGVVAAGVGFPADRPERFHRNVWRQVQPMVLYAIQVIAISVAQAYCEPPPMILSDIAGLMLLRFDRPSQLHYAFKTLAYTMINLRHYRTG
jgi:hypothetical protein